MTKLTIKDCLETAKKYDGECLSTQYYNNTTIMEWKCKDGHIFQKSFKGVRRGVWCKKCKETPKRRITFR